MQNEQKKNEKKNSNNKQSMPLTQNFGDILKQALEKRNVRNNYVRINAGCNNS